MTIAIDLRPLHEGYGGVAEYTRALVFALLRNDHTNDYVFFSNSYRVRHQFEEISHLRATHAGFRIPSKLLNASIRVFGFPHIDSLIEKKCGKRIDLFFAPNCDFFSFKSHVKKVVTLHDLSFEVYPEFLSTRSRRWHALVNPRGIIKNFDHIITVSEHTRHTVVNQFCVDQAKVTAIPLGVDAALPALRHQAPAGLPVKYILCWGSTDARKNIPHALRAFAIARSRQPQSFENLSIVIAGRCEGSQRKILIQIAGEYGVEKQCFFTGHVNNEERAYLYAHALCLVYPSFYEGFGLPPVEAATYGTPVIASRSSALAEIIGDGALLIDPYDEEDLVATLILIMQDGRLREHYSKRGSEVVAKYSWDRTALATIDVFNRLMK